jgi:hypothetical protein
MCIIFFCLLGWTEVGLVCHMDCEAHRGKGVECNLGSSLHERKDRKGVGRSDSQDVNGLLPGGKGS